MKNIPPRYLLVGRRRRVLHDNLLSVLLALSLLFNMIPVTVAVELAGQKINNATNYRKQKQQPEQLVVDIGVILDLDESALVGKMSKTSISMALSDFYLLHNHATATRIVPHFRNSSSDVVEAASAAIDLLKNERVKAIIGPHRSTQADFVIDIGNKAKIPIISLATSPSHSPKENPCFIRAAQCSASQAQPIADIVKAFGWREVVFVYEDSDFGRGLIPYLTDAMTNVNCQVKYRSVLFPSVSDDQILQQLYKLMSMQTRVFVVHVLPQLASRLFVLAKEAGMMKKGYAWIITDTLSSLLHSLSDQDIDSMQGLLGVKPHIPRSNLLHNFSTRWKMQFQKENPDVDKLELDMYGIWSYDSTFALAMAVEGVGAAANVQQYEKTHDMIMNTEKVTDLAAIGTSELGSRLVPVMRNIRFKGLSGDFHVVDGQLKASAYEIVNVIGKGEKRIGFWTSQHGISNKMNPRGHLQGYPYTSDRDNLGVIIWPGETYGVPRGWEIPTNGKTLKVGVPTKGDFEKFIKVQRNNQTNQVIASGFCVDVFDAVMKALPYDVPFEYVPFVGSEGNNSGSYDDLVYQVHLGKFDAVVGDITIRENRSRFVDFTLPYTESGVTLVVPIKNDEKRKDGWIFMEPLEIKLWITTAAFFVYTGFVVWVLEHQVNKEFRGRPYKQVGMMIYFSFSTMVFAHTEEKVMSNLTRFVVIVWVFVVLVLTSSYTASLTSMLTVNQLQPAYNDINDLVRNGENIGCNVGSFTLGMLKNDMKVDDTKIRKYNTFEEYDEALSKGSRNGGVAAILEELPYLRLFLAKYCSKYTLVGPTYKTAGFGFALPQGSPLVQDMSRAVLQVTEEKIRAISDHWFQKEADCPEQGGVSITSDRLQLESFMGLFIIAGTSSSAALIIFAFIFVSENRGILFSEGTIWEKLVAIAKTFDNKKDDRKTRTEMNEAAANAHEHNSNDTGNTNDVIADYPASPALSEYHQAGAVFVLEEGFSTTEPGTPVHETNSERLSAG